MESWLELGFDQAWELATSLEREREVISLLTIRYKNCLFFGSERVYWSDMLLDSVDITSVSNISVGPQVTDLTPLQKVENLAGIIIDRCGVTDLSPLVSVRGLRDITINKGAVKDIGPLRGLRHLVALTVSDVQVSDLTPLEGMRSLRSLTLNHLPSTDLRPLEGLHNLRFLCLRSPSAVDLSPLLQLPRLKTLLLDFRTPILGHGIIRKLEERGVVVRK